MMGVYICMYVSILLFFWVVDPKGGGGNKLMGGLEKKVKGRERIGWGRGGFRFDK